MAMHRIGRALPAGIGRLVSWYRRASRYDLVLAVIPVVFLVALGLGTTLELSPTTAVAAAAGLSGLALVDALFLNPPRGPSAGDPPG